MLPSLPATIMALLLAGLTAAPTAATAAAGEVTIYRCVDAKGRLTLRDTPCAKGERQEAVTMVRPKDAPPRPRTPAPAADAPAPVPALASRVTVVQAPRPMYECVTPDGERYTSDTSEGRPRWAPLWTLGYPVLPQGARSEGSVDLRYRSGGLAVSAQSRTGVAPVAPIAAYGAGSWIRDACFALPVAEACDRLRDRRDEVRRQFFNAQPSERDVLRVEERSLNARLDSDCAAP